MTHIAMEPAAATGTAPRTVDVDVPQAKALATEAVALVRHWLTEAAKVPVDASAQQLAGVLKDPNGLEFTVGFVDGVVRPEDLNVAARNHGPDPAAGCHPRRAQGPARNGGPPDC